MIQSALIKKQRIIICILLALIILTIVVGMGMGYASLSYDRLIPTLFGQGTFKEEFILFSIRLPRIIITLLAGMALALSGAILQGVTRNDLADPGILGINSGAGVAVAIFFLFFPVSADSFVYLIPLLAFIGALFTAVLIYGLSYKKEAGLQPVKLVLIGVGCSMALSGVMIVLISSAERAKVDFIAKWLAGNIWGDDWPFILALLPWLITLIPFTLYKANRLNLLGLSEPVAVGVGMSVEKERISLLLAAVALAASTVSVTGGISFIGLMAPHMAKALVGPRNQLFIPIALLLGGWFLLIADLIGRNIFDPNSIPAGIMVSLIGAPYFIYLLLKK
ncbi:fecCD transport family protein [Anoxybacillus sp. B7M1]|jgi:iron complex transport system permease protein|uniref:Iron ABC transporter permease n=1 Tax=Anoxybacteroides rupiense TaxID=311460 RepID=A0ABD5IWU0_9BACL|nr:MULTISPECIES: iron ABC transporter permease [Anoxybacillus]ANB55808.1 fecCD transport family protein [Anoxybacillus sp. B2M1]ANB65987.1 fecCD transport family protein [Anoxybacillus sp. B7M1]KXG09511.1 putative siderophore transport system permease protein YfhA [Anoxybacillus sp. P3H1B]MBB3908861.1 iron complex transport system permease protein [Anoxybacillus rupiensis]MED5052805.1 iron ABC transporter permease [Anoxybacillus rupiensis]